MIFPNGSKELLHKPRPGKWTSLRQIMLVWIVCKRFQFERVVTICDIMALPVRSSKQIEKRIADPVKDEQHFDLLPEMDLLVAHKLSLIMWLPGDPYEDEERQAGSQAVVGLKTCRPLVFGLWPSEKHDVAG